MLRRKLAIFQKFHTKLGYFTEFKFHIRGEGVAPSPYFSLEVIGVVNVGEGDIASLDRAHIEVFAAT